MTGRVLKRLFGMREEYVLATKVRMGTMPGDNGSGLSRNHILASIDASLQRLGLDYVDLYQIHRWPARSRGAGVQRRAGDDGPGLDRALTGRRP